MLYKVAIIKPSLIREKIANDNKDNRQQLVCRFPKYNLSNLGYADYLEYFIGHLVLHIGTKGIGKGQYILQNRTLFNIP